ncbi:MAG: CPBP family intramembrane metalloprotease [Acidobacteriia bacterium]|nr:CPBP family intramembrane metalloprotease [Terriglobia bacterium]
MRLASVWQRIPVIVRAVVGGVLVTGAVTIPWSMLASANFRYWPSIPWSALVAAPVLWLYWQYLKGRGWPASTVAARRINLGLRSLSSDVWGMALFAGMIGLGALLAFQAVLARLVPLPPEQQMPDVSRMPVPTMAVLVIMGSLVAGFTEEAGFRGYMQGAIARRHGPVAAILVSGTVFGFAHFTHPTVGLAHLPYYIAVSAVFGMLAYLTGSIMPGVVLHAFGDAFDGLLLVTSGRSTWPEPPPSKGLVWEAGTDLAFWGLCAWAGLWILGAVLTYRFLAGEVRAERKLDHRLSETPVQLLR